MEEYEEIRGFSKKITTNSEEAQILCDRAFIQMFGTGYLEAIRLFKLALEIDENIPFALWGISYSYGPGINYNDLTPDYYRDGYEAYLKALEKIDYANEWERDLINSLQYRFPVEIPKTFEEKIKVIRNYRKEFKKIYEKYPYDFEITSLYCESMVTIHRTMLWNIDKSPTPEVLELKEILESKMKIKYHPQICHLLIHTLEHHPVYYKDALEAAELLQKNQKGIAHYYHMPCHIFIYYGRFKECLDLSIKSVESAYDVLKRTDKYKIYTISFFHEVIYAVFSAMFLGNYEIAIKYALILKDELDEKLLSKTEYGMEWYYSTYYHVFVRFGKWDEIISQEIHLDESLPITKVVQRYARTVAYAVKGNVVESEKELALFEELKENLLKTKIIGNNPAENVLNVGHKMALGELYYRKGEFEKGFNYLRESVALCDGLKFSEPWDWMQPPRHALGALLLEQGYIEESINVYSEDLKRYNNNIWSLTGLEECYEKSICRLNDGIDNSIITNYEILLKEVKEKISELKQDDDNRIKSSCFCKKNKTEL